MKIIDHNGRLFGKISVIDLLVIAVVVVMAAALHFKSNQTHTGTTVTERPIIFQIRATGLRTYQANAIHLETEIYDKDYESNGALGVIKEIQVVRDPGTVMSYLNDGTVAMLEAEDTVDLLITVQGKGLLNGRNWSINRIYDLGVNSARSYCTNTCQFIGNIASIR